MGMRFTRVQETSSPGAYRTTDNSKCIGPERTITISHKCRHRHLPLYAVEGCDFQQERADQEIGHQNHF